MNKKLIAKELIRIADELITQDVKLERDQLAADIQDEIQSLFPRSLVVSKYKINLGEWIGVMFTLGERGEWENNIPHNDDVYTTFTVWFGKDGNMEVRADHGFGIMVKPEAGSFMAYDRVKVPFNKTKVNGGDNQKVLALFHKGFSRLKALLKQHKDNLGHPQYAEGKF